MRRHHPNHQMDIPVSLEIWKQLTGASFDTGYAKEDWEIAAEAISEWMRRHNPDAIPMPLVHGYQWKSVFLPDGTLLRTVSGGKNHHCLIEGDKILYNGQAVSPSGFVNAAGGIRRNAWRCTWILFPDSKEWKLADTLRGRQRPRRARKSAHDIQPSPATQPAPVRAPANDLPVAGSPPTQNVYTAASTSESSQVQRPRHERDPQTNQHAEQHGWRQGPGTTLSKAGFIRGADRRMNGDDRMVTLLRQELIPLLYRMSAFAGTEHEPGT